MNQIVHFKVKNVSGAVLPFLYLEANYLLAELAEYAVDSRSTCHAGMSLGAGEVSACVSTGAGFSSPTEIFISTHIFE